jgi:tetratricopeptide (TPR) repeat protein
MSITGNLQTMELSEVLQWLGNTNKTGVLVLSNGLVEKRIIFMRGEVVMTASTDPKEYLGHFLVSHGLIDEVTLAEAMAMQDENKMLLGKILVTIGAIEETQLDRMLSLKLEESVYEIFTWPSGDFRFIDEELDESSIIPLKFNVNALALEGSRRADEWQQLRDTIPSKECVAVATGQLRAEESDTVATRVLDLVNDDRTVEEIALHAHASEFQVYRVLAGQVEQGSLKLIRPRLATPGGHAPAEGATEHDSSGLLGKAEGLLRGNEYEQAIGHFRAALNLDPHNEKIRTRTAVVEAEIAKRLQEEGLHPESVPRLKRAMEELAQLQISPHEGFILSRVNGTYDIQTILKISPMPSINALLVFRSLHAAGHIDLDQPKS